ncbi:MAG: hypothetical protein CSYNP_01849 [Syntrophus sp. SKADARSKE-3]|nr:hypothetical protein [Syntrophus sp. SKADARSKE-3]
MNQTNKYYEHSGIIGFLGPVYMIILGSLGALVFGAIYGYATDYISHLPGRGLVALRLFITFGLGCVVGFLVGIGGRYGKVRNPKALLFFGFISGLIAEYANWVSWVFAYYKQQTLILSPFDMLEFAKSLESNISGINFNDWTPAVIIIYLFWVIEAIIIIGSAMIVARMMLSSTPFCERCDKWIKEEDLISPLDPIGSPDELKSRLEQGDFSLLKSLKIKAAETDAYTQIKLRHCPSCQHSNYLTIRAEIVSVDSNNKKKKSGTDIITNLIITYEQYKMINEQWQ